MENRVGLKQKHVKKQRTRRPKASGHDHESKGPPTEAQDQPILRQYVIQKKGCSLKPQDLIQLQKSFGNSVVNRIVRNHHETQRASSQEINRSTDSSRNYIGRRGSKTALIQTLKTDAPKSIERKGEEEFRRAVRLYRDGNYHGAMKIFASLQNKHLTGDRHSKVLYNLGICAKRLGRNATALSYFEEYLGWYGANSVKGNLQINQLKKKLGLLATKEAVEKKKQISPAAAAKQLKETGRIAKDSRYSEAILAYERLSRQPGVPEYIKASAVMNIAVCNYRLGRFSSVITYINRYMAYPNANLRKANQFLQSALKMLKHEKKGDSRDDYGTAMQNIGPLYKQARQLFDQRKFKEASFTYRQVAQQPGATLFKGNAWFQAAKCEFRLGRYGVAYRYLKQALKHNADNQNEAMILLNNILLKQGNQGFADGVSLYRKGRYAQAIVQFENVRHHQLLEETKKTMALFNIGICNYRMRRYATALRVFTAYLGAPGANVAKGKTLVNRMKSKLGLPVSKKELAEQKAMTVDDAIKRHMEAVALIKEKKYPKAIINYELLANSPGVPEDFRSTALLNAGICLYRLRRFSAAIVYFEQNLATGAPRKRKAKYWINKCKRVLGLPVTTSSKS